MSTQDRICLTCGRTDGRFESHHVAGRMNNEKLVVDLCLPCHHLITSWQYQVGVYLGDGPRHPVERVRATVVGALLLVRLFGYRHPDLTPMPADAARLLVRSMSASLDLTGPQDREGASLPDPTRVKTYDIRPSVHAMDRAEAWADLAHNVIWELCSHELASAVFDAGPTGLEFDDGTVPALIDFRTIVHEVIGQVAELDADNELGTAIRLVLIACIRAFPWWVPDVAP